MARSTVSLGPLKSKIENSEVLTLRDLDAWAFTGTALAVLGHPIKHSLSPLMHNSALADVSREDRQYEDWQYFRFEVHPSDLSPALVALYEKGFHGINLTVPHKILAVREVSTIDPAAQSVGAINTLKRTSTGWTGFNTDGYGLSTALQESLGLELRGQHVVLLGAGGAARGAAVECLQRQCASLWIANRTPENLAKLLNTLRPITGEIPLRGFTLGQVPADLPAGVVVINATSAGLHVDDPTPINLADLPHPAGVFDMIYNPPLTPLLHAAKQLGLPHANGLSMLVHQGAKALEIWSGVSAARTAPAMSAVLAPSLNSAT